mmetsp:Transcript_20281/g.45103  ORF Transcript_20281/g.45103 Transcript_20281/m.45103 type:complete len:201 (+) Transcript_20281:1284-1886(+)
MAARAAKSTSSASARVCGLCGINVSKTLSARRGCCSGDRVPVPFAPSAPPAGSALAVRPSRVLPTDPIVDVCRSKLGVTYSRCCRAKTPLCARGRSCEEYFVTVGPVTVSPNLLPFPLADIGLPASTLSHTSSPSSSKTDVKPGECDRSVESSKESLDRVRDLALVGCALLGSRFFLLLGLRGAAGIGHAAAAIRSATGS